jgi:hypothetical protein
MAGHDHKRVQFHLGVLKDIPPAGWFAGVIYLVQTPRSKRFLFDISRSKSGKTAQPSDPGQRGPKSLRCVAFGHFIALKIQVNSYFLKTANLYHAVNKKGRADAVGLFKIAAAVCLEFLDA